MTFEWRLIKGLIIFALAAWLSGIVSVSGSEDHRFKSRQGGVRFFMENITMLVSYTKKCRLFVYYITFLSAFLNSYFKD
jgi:hypothetical protein